MNPSQFQPLTPATDAAALARLRALPAADADALLDALDALPTPVSRQDHLIGAHRLALGLPALADWMHAARDARGERRFGEFLDDVRRAAERAEAFRELLTRAEQLHQVNIALLAARLFDALVARDHAAIETFARTFAEVVSGIGKSAAPPSALSLIS